MFEKSNTTVHDALEMVIAFSVKFRTTQEARESLFEMLKICAGPKFEDLKFSNYKMSKLFDAPPDKIVFNFY